MNLYMIVASAAVGFMVGLTGAGGGALMTPMLILMFSVKPTAAISSDLVAALVMRPFGAAVHFKRGSVNLRLVGWLTAGSVPGALIGAYLIHLLATTPAATSDVEHVLGAALLIGALGMVVRRVLDHRSGAKRLGLVEHVAVRPIATMVIGVLGGLLVGATSVGAGSLMIVLLLTLYPALNARNLVGTDLAQAIPLTGAAAVGALLFGQVQVAVTSAVVIGAVPAVLLGAYLSSRISDRALRPAMFLLIVASGLKYIGLSTMALTWVAGALVLLYVTYAGRRRFGPREEVRNGAGRNSADHPGGDGRTDVVAA